MFAIDVEGKEDRLGKESKPLHREGKPDEGAAERHEAGPQKPQLKGEDGAGDRADGEQHPRRTYPAAGKLVIELFSAAKRQPFGNHQHKRQPDPDGRVDDVETERNAHQGACRENVITTTNTIDFFICFHLLFLRIQLLLNGNSRPGPSFISPIYCMYPGPDRIHPHGYPPGAALELNNFPRIEKSAKLEILYIIVDVILINYSNQHVATLSLKIG